MRSLDVSHGVNVQGADVYEVQTLTERAHSEKPRNPAFSSGKYS